MVAAVTVTGSTAAGNELARAAGAKKFVGELGSNAANIVCADADLSDAATRIAGAGFEASGQQCISAQRVIVERPVFDRFLELFVAAAKKLKVGDPEDNATDVGPMVSRAAADRVEAMVDDAVAKGAKLVRKPERHGCILGPAIVAEAPTRGAADGRGSVRPGRGRAARGQCRRRDRTRQLVGVRAAGRLLHQEPRNRVQGVAQLRVGSLWINDASRFRLDMYPFGGVGSSGFGREGVRYAMEELSQWKFTGMRFNA